MGLLFFTAEAWLRRLARGAGESPFSIEEACSLAGNLWRHQKEMGETVGSEYTVGGGGAVPMEKSCAKLRAPS